MLKTPVSNRVPSVSSLAQLKALARSSARYAKLAIVSAKNIGGDVVDGDVDGAIRWLTLNAHEVGETAVVGEVNHCRSLV